MIGVEVTWFIGLVFDLLRRARAGGESGGKRSFTHRDRQLVKSA